MNTAPAIDLPTGKVLVVDDDDQVRMVLARSLERGGHAVIVAPSARQGLAMLETQHVDVVVSDINMPDMDGTQMVRQLRQSGSTTPVIFLTGRPSMDSAVQAVEFRATRYLTKPVDHEELRAAVSGAVATSVEQARHQLTLATEEASRRERAKLDSELTAAIDKLWMAYQPIVTAKNTALVACEALVRSGHASMPHPGVIFPAAEKLSRVDELGSVIRDVAPKPMETADADVLLFVNLHSTELGDESLYRADTPLGRIASRVVLEITERASLDTVERVTDCVEKLRGLGYRIAVDDLGAGYSGLTALALLEPEFVKLDMSLIRNIDTSATLQRIVKGMIRLSHDLGAKVVAEGIETPEEHHWLAEAGCDLLQGFLFGRPAAEFPVRQNPG